MKKIILVLTLLAVYVSECSAWITTYNDYYEHKVLPKLDEICKNVLAEASKYISNSEPQLEIKLSRKERYFSEETMQFLGDSNPRATYSSVIWRAVWVQGRTVIAG